MKFPREIMLMILEEKFKIERRERFEACKENVLRLLRFPEIIFETVNANLSYHVFKLNNFWWLITENRLYIPVFTTFERISVGGRYYVEEW